LVMFLGFRWAHVQQQYSRSVHATSQSIRPSQVSTASEEHWGEKACVRSY